MEYGGSRLSTKQSQELRRKFPTGLQFFKYFFELRVLVIVYESCVPRVSVWHNGLHHWHTKTRNFLMVKDLLLVCVSAGVGVCDGEFVFCSVCV